MREEEESVAFRTSREVCDFMRVKNENGSGPQVNYLKPFSKKTVEFLSSGDWSWSENLTVKVLFTKRDHKRWTSNRDQYNHQDSDTETN